MSEGEDDEVTTLTPRVESLERRSNQYEKDIRHIYGELASHTGILDEHTRTLRDHSRQLRWLRQGMTSLLVHVGLDVPPDEPADEEE